MAGIFSPQQQQALNQAADTVGSIFRDRFEAKEAESFQTNELARFFAETAAQRENIATQDTPEGMVNAMKQYNHNILLPFITTATAKYMNNPRVMQVVQQVKNSAEKELDQFVNVSRLGLEKQRVGIEQSREDRMASQQQAQESRAQELFPLQKQQAQAGIEASQAQAALARARASQLNQENQPQTFADVLNYARNAKDRQYKFEVDKRTENEVVARVVQQNRGQLYPSKSGIWGSQPNAALGQSPKEKEAQNRTEALDYLRQKGILKDVYTAGRVAAQLGPDESVAQQLVNSGLNKEAVKMVFPEARITYEDPYQGIKGKIDDKISDQSTVSIITGMPQSPAFNFPDLKTYFDQSVDNLKSYKDLPMPIQRIFDVIQTDKLGNAIVRAGDPETGQMKEYPLDNKHVVQSINEVLHGAARDLILNDLVQKNTQKYKEVNSFLDKVIKRFLSEVVLEKSPLTKEQLSLQPESFWEMLTHESLKVPNPLNLLKSAGSKAKETGKGLKLLYDWANE